MCPFEFDRLIAQNSILETLSRRKQSADDGTISSLAFDLLASVDGVLLDSSPQSVPRISIAFRWNQSIAHRTTLRPTLSSQRPIPCSRATADHFRSWTIHADVFQRLRPSICLWHHQGVTLVSISDHSLTDLISSVERSYQDCRTRL